MNLLVKPGVDFGHAVPAAEADDLPVFLIHLDHVILDDLFLLPYLLCNKTEQANGGETSLVRVLGQTSLCTLKLAR